MAKAKAKAASVKKSKVTANEEVVPGNKRPLKKFKLKPKQWFFFLEGFNGEKPSGGPTVSSTLRDENGNPTGESVEWPDAKADPDGSNGKLKVIGTPTLVKPSRGARGVTSDLIGDLNVTVMFPSGPASMSISSVAYEP